MSPNRALPSPASLSRATVYVSVAVERGRSVCRSTSMRWVATGFGSVRVSVARTVPRRSTPAGDERTRTVPLTSYVPGSGVSRPPGSGPVATVRPSRRRVQVPEVRQAYRTVVPPRRQVAGADSDVPAPPPFAQRPTTARWPPGPFRVPAGEQTVVAVAAGGGSGARCRGAAPAGAPTAVQPVTASTAAAVNSKGVLRKLGRTGTESSSSSGRRAAGCRSRVSRRGCGTPGGPDGSHAGRYGSGPVHVARMGQVVRARVRGRPVGGETGRGGRIGLRGKRVECRRPSGAPAPGTADARAPSAPGIRRVCQAASMPLVQAAPGSGVCGPCTYFVRNCWTRGSDALSTVSCLPQADSMRAPAWSATGLISV